MTQAALGASAAVLGIWSAEPWVCIGALAILTAENFSVSRRCRVSRAGLTLAWGCTLAVLGSRAARPLPAADPGIVLPAVLMTTAILLASTRLDRDSGCGGWRLLGIAWGFLGSCTCIAYSYKLNLPGLFYSGLVLFLAMLVLCRASFRLPATAVIAVHTLILLTIAVPSLDCVLRLNRGKVSLADNGVQPYLFRNAIRDPEGFVAWHKYAMREWTKWTRKFCMHDPARVLPSRLRPNTRGLFFRSPLSINSLGFRGKEIPKDKGRAYRIVALGESTTFGVTMDPGDKPWPELLEELIRNRLKPSRPVEVINAGAPGYDLRNSLDLLRSDILPLKPDLILSYHGANGFPLILSAMPPTAVRYPPVYYSRPLNLLADIEFNLRIRLFRYFQTAKLADRPPSDVVALDTPYARAYRDLIRIAATNGIDLVLANYSMAVNGRSDPRVIEFYRKQSLAIYWQIKANELHSEIVRELAQKNPGVGFVDTLPSLDGRNDEFTDLVHLTQDGRRHLAELFFTAVRPILERNLPCPDSSSSSTATNRVP